jgi:hypothetical protein
MGRLATSPQRRCGVGPYESKVLLATGSGAGAGRRGEAGFISTHITAEGWMAKDTGWREYPTNVEIARLAYRLYEERGRHDGHDMDDWLGAERALAWQYAYYGQ